MSRPERKPLEIHPKDAAGPSCAKRVLIDIRDGPERSAGAPPGAQALSAQEVVERCRKDPAFASRGGLLLCAEGVRSLAAARELHQQGFSGFFSIIGGYQAWMAQGLPVQPSGGLGAVQSERYARHIVMPQVGIEGQRKLLRSRILLVGLGGLNSPAALYLAAAGVGCLGLADFDLVERSNLQRQIIHGESSVGTAKTESAAARILALNPEVELEFVESAIDSSNAEAAVRGWDVVIDGTDRFDSRYALNRACADHGVPLVYGAVMRFQGQVSVFWPNPRERAPDAPSNRPCFRCLMPEPPADGAAPSCADAGVLGVLPGIVGTLQATEALKLVLGIGRPLIGRLLLIDALDMAFREMRISRRENCRDCPRGPSDLDGTGLTIRP